MNTYRKWDPVMRRYETELPEANALKVTEELAADTRDTAPNPRDFGLTAEGVTAYEKAISEWQDERYAEEIARQAEGWIRAGHSPEEAYELAVKYCP